MVKFTAFVTLFLINRMSVSSNPMPLPEGSTTFDDNLDMDDESRLQQVYPLVTLDSSLSQTQKQLIIKLLSDRTKSQVSNGDGERSFADFSKMAFWSIVTAATFNDTTITVPVSENEIASIHVDPSLSVLNVTKASHIDLTASKNWFTNVYTGHGCYCWPEDPEKISGFGLPVDELDETCHDLYTCYNCVKSLDECRGIDVFTADYACAFFSSNSNHIDATCDVENNSNCLRALCECDRKFIKTAIHKHKDPVNTGIFNTGACQPNDHPIENKGCCGDFPEVRMFDQSKDCCDSVGGVFPISSLLGQGGQCEGAYTGAPDIEHLMNTLGYDASKTDIGLVEAAHH